MFITSTSPGAVCSSERFDRASFRSLPSGLWACRYQLRADPGSRSGDDDGGSGLRHRGRRPHRPVLCTAFQAGPVSATMMKGRRAARTPGIGTAGAATGPALAAAGGARRERCDCLRRLIVLRRRGHCSLCLALAVASPWRPGRPSANDGEPRVGLAILRPSSALPLWSASQGAATAARNELVSAGRGSPAPLRHNACAGSPLSPVTRAVSPACSSHPNAPPQGCLFCAGPQAKMLHG